MKNFEVRVPHFSNDACCSMKRNKRYRLVTLIRNRTGLGVFFLHTLVEVGMQPTNGANVTIEGNHSAGFQQPFNPPLTWAMRTIMG